MKKLALLSILSWIVLITISFLWNYTNARKEQERLALLSARSFFEHIVITRLWNARHGGVYVPVTERTRPNPYLEVPMRDIVVNDELTLTMVNPAFMTRQVSEIAMEQQGVQFHITSLKPIRPENKPSEIEEEILKEFEKGLKEKGMFVSKGAQTSYFYMAPLRAEKACLKCHEKQGYKEGDIRGGISVSSPFVMEMQLFPLIAGHFTIGVFGFFGIIMASRRLSDAYETIKKQAVFDALTGVPNRRSFSESILTEFKLSQRHRQPLAVIMCDVDNFKVYNDTYGHGSGDLCLKKVAQTVKSSLNRPGDFCARYGGEEFVVLLPNTGLDGAMQVAERIRSSIEEMGIPHEKSLPAKVVTLSVGVAVSKGISLVSQEELVKQADRALYSAKQQGRNQVQSFSEATLFVPEVCSGS